jgi:methionine-rich copper-binding protein CopC
MTQHTAPLPLLRGLALAAVGTLFAAGSVLGFVTPAQAHNYLVSSTPEAGSTLTELPDEFSITTNEALLDLSGTGAGFALEVVDSDGLFYGDGCVRVEESSIFTAAALGAAGEYTVIWQGVSEDGHTVSDEFTFEWAPATAAEPSVGSATAPACAGTTVSSTAGATDAGSASGTTPVTTQSSLTDALWIGGAVLAIVAAVVVTLLVTGRRKPRED